MPYDIASLAELILSSNCNSIGILTGAGVSVASGIPDFRSPGGMYDTLQPERLTATDHQKHLMRHDPTYVVSWEVFRENAFPYLEVRRPFILGTRNQQWKATIAHRFFELLHTKTNKLTRLYTQNIDGLDGQCDELPPEKIVHVHGTLSQASCEGCGQDMAFDDFCDAIQTQIKDIYNIDPEAPKESTPVCCPNCGKAVVKPKTVLFGKNLPMAFFERIEEDLPTLDMLIVAGTSLVVSPANSLVYRVPKDTIRVVVNNEPVGKELGIEYGPTTTRDFFAQGDCDSVFLNLVRELGWLDDLEAKKGELPPSSVKLLESRT